MNELSSMEINKCYRRLLWLIEECYYAISCIEQIRSGEISAKKPATIKHLEVIIVGYLIVKMQCLFDDTNTNGGSISFERLPKIMKDKMNHSVLSEYKDEYSKIKSNHKDLLSRLKANRNKGNAHLQYTEELGWDDEIGNKVNGFELLGLKPFVAKSAENVLLTSRNFPCDEGKQLLAELRSLLK